jgi:hypothetical protein
MEDLSASTPRRGFVKSIAAGAAALVAAGSWSPAWAAANPNEESPALSDAWVAKIRGKHKQVFDATSPNGGFAPAFALNFMQGYKDTHNSPASDLTAVISFRHFAMPMVLNDSVWAKYHIGEIIGVTDPKTSAPATRNIFRDAVPLSPGLTYEQLLARPSIIMTACNVALTVISGLAAPKAGVSADVAKAEWTAGLIPGVNLVPSGVYAISRAQEAGCSYCNAG